MVRQAQETFYGKRFMEIELPSGQPDFVKLTEGYGHVGIRISKRNDIRPALEKVFNMETQLVFVNIIICPDEKA